ERLAAALAHDLPDVAIQPPSRLLPSLASQARSAQRIEQTHLTADAIRGSLDRARAAADFTPGAFEPFAERLPRLLDRSARLTQEGYVAHGLSDITDRFVAFDHDRWSLATYVFPTSAEQTAHLQRIVDAVNPSATLTGLTLVNRELAR